MLTNNKSSDQYIENRIKHAKKQSVVFFLFMMLSVFAAMHFYNQLRIKNEELEKTKLFLTEKTDQLSIKNEELEKTKLFLTEKTELLKKHSKTIADLYKKLAQFNKSKNQLGIEISDSLKRLSNFVDSLNEYSEYQEYKALSLAVGSKGKYAYGYSNGQPNQKKAIDRALHECQKRLTIYKVDSDCKLYAIGNKVVWNE